MGILVLTVIGMALLVTIATLCLIIISKRPDEVTWFYCTGSRLKEIAVYDDAIYEFRRSLLGDVTISVTKDGRTVAEFTI